MLKIAHKLGMGLIAADVAAIVPHSVAVTAEEKMASGNSYDPPRMKTTGENAVLLLLENGAHIILPGTVEEVAAAVDKADEWKPPHTPRGKTTD